ncbi:phage tail protein [Salinarimonas chemoclinalis]|uniref:phage tail protein n=1 Tax=Salinarimonas chemoclinalis TaxID=3241599 RepID=UPI0035580A2C
METFIATILIWAPNFAPKNWAYCGGQLMAISQNSALFSLLGTTYGGDGQTTFALPDLRSRVPIGAGMGQGPGLSDYRLGVKGGVEDVTLNQLEMPSHSHVAQGEIRAFDTNATSSSPLAGGALATVGIPDGPSFTNVNAYATAGGSPVLLSPQGVSVQIGNTGGNLSHENRMPFEGLSFIIALFGIYPSRG